MDKDRRGDDRLECTTVQSTLVFSDPLEKPLISGLGISDYSDMGEYNIPEPEITDVRWGEFVQGFYEHWMWVSENPDARLTRGPRNISLVREGILFAGEKFPELASTHNTLGRLRRECGRIKEGKMREDLDGVGYTFRSDNYFSFEKPVEK
jgi:hypothetical protein